MEMIRSGMEKALVHYDFLAGRLKYDEKGRQEIDCDGAGVSYVMASSELKLEDLGELYPNPAFLQLIPMPELTHELEERPLFAIQATLFKCGSYAFGVSLNHAAMDGVGFLTFFLNLACLISNQRLAITPYTNRELLAARSPPRVTFSHPEYVKLEEIVKMLPTRKSPPEDHEFKQFHLSSKDISTLKEKARAGNTLDPKIITNFNVVAAYIWKCKSLATYGPDENKTSTLLYAVDIRRKIQPNLPSSYAGNGVFYAYAKATCRDLDTSPFPNIVKMVSEGVARITDEYIRSAIDSCQVSVRFPIGDVIVTSWWKLDFGEMEFEWGKPKYFCPVPDPKTKVVMLSPGVDKGVGVLIRLPSSKMEKFCSLFYKDFGPSQSRL
ncbi:shikimate O-hydroxycinnamoyltransferase-like [Asparagus officinalis]|nr:shikimate O-hydroxycinnamoyltransferase-like [Asparagus officinalis]